MSRTTDDLIASLAAVVPAVAPGAAPRRVAMGLGLGVVGSAALMWIWLGPRPDLAQAVATPMFWMKLGYAAITGLIAAGVLTRLARPGVRPGRLAALAFAPFALVSAMALVRMAQTPPEAHRAMLMGHSAMFCPWRISPAPAPHKTSPRNRSATASKSSWRLTLRRAQKRWICCTTCAPNCGARWWDSNRAMTTAPSSTTAARWSRSTAAGPSIGCAFLPSSSSAAICRVSLRRVGTNVNWTVCRPLPGSPCGSMRSTRPTPI